MRSPESPVMTQTSDTSSQSLGASAWKPRRVLIAFVATIALALAGRAIVAGEGAIPLLGIAIALMLLTVAPVGLALLLANMDACLLYTSPSPRDRTRSRMPSSA